MTYNYQLSLSFLQHVLVLCNIILLQQPLLVFSIPALTMSFPAGMQQGVTNSYGVVYNVSRDWMSSSSYMYDRDPRLGAGRLHNTSANAALPSFVFSFIRIVHISSLEQCKGQ